jgi:hypothetical protein
MQGNIADFHCPDLTKGKRKWPQHRVHDLEKEKKEVFIAVVREQNFK